MTYVCPKCGHILEVFIEAAEVFCSHDGTRWYGTQAAVMVLAPVVAKCSRQMIVKVAAEIRTERRRFPLFMHTFILAVPWPKTGENLGTLARTADALGACLAVPKEANATRALHRGNTIGIDKVCVHWIEPDPITWLEDARGQDRILIAVELAHGAIPLSEFEGSLEPVVIVLGNESQGIPQAALDLCHEVVEIPMRGVGNSLNVAVAGSLVAYKWMGWT